MKRRAFLLKDVKLKAESLGRGTSFPQHRTALRAQL